jgi:hypothetical protein
MSFGLDNANAGPHKRQAATSYNAEFVSRDCAVQMRARRLHKILCCVWFAPWEAPHVNNNRSRAEDIDQLPE